MEPSSGHPVMQLSAALRELIRLRDEDLLTEVEYQYQRPWGGEVQGQHEEGRYQRPLCHQVRGFAQPVVS